MSFSLRGALGRRRHRGRGKIPAGACVMIGGCPSWRASRDGPSPARLMRERSRCNDFRGSHPARGASGRSAEATRRDHRGGGILDRRSRLGGAAGAAGRIGLLPRWRRGLHPGGAARAGRSPGPRQALGLRASTEPYALLLARTARERFAAGWALSESGASGPTGNRYGDAAGHSCIAVVGAAGERAITLETGSSDRVANMHAFAAAALDLLARGAGGGLTPEASSPAFVGRPYDRYRAMGIVASLRTG